MPTKSTCTPGRIRSRSFGRQAAIIFAMAQWLVKEEPEHYAYDQLERDRKTVWAGVRNPLAQKHLRSIRKGDRIFYYHTGKQKAVVAVARADDERLSRCILRVGIGVRRRHRSGWR